MHLRLYYVEELMDPFTSKEEMINYLSFIYKDPFKVQNARLNYKVLNIKTIKTFLTFQTYFLYLAGQAQILQEDLLPDLFNKLTLDLQQAILPIFITVQTLKELTDQC